MIEEIDKYEPHSTGAKRADLKRAIALCRKHGKDIRFFRFTPYGDVSTRLSLVSNLFSFLRHKYGVHGFIEFSWNRGWGYDSLKIIFEDPRLNREYGQKQVNVIVSNATLDPTLERAAVLLTDDDVLAMYRQMHKAMMKKSLSESLPDPTICEGRQRIARLNDELSGSGCQVVREIDVLFATNVEVVDVADQLNVPWCNTVSCYHKTLVARNMGMCQLAVLNCRPTGYGDILVRDEDADMVLRRLTRVRAQRGLRENANLSWLASRLQSIAVQRTTRYFIDEVRYDGEIKDVVSAAKSIGAPCYLIYGSYLQLDDDDLDCCTKIEKIFRELEDTSDERSLVLITCSQSISDAIVFQSDADAVLRHLTRNQARKGLHENTSPLDSYLKTVIRIFHRKLEGTQYQLDGIMYDGSTYSIQDAAQSLGIEYLSVDAIYDSALLKRSLSQFGDETELTVILPVWSAHKIIVARSDAGRLMRYLAHNQAKKGLNESLPVFYEIILNHLRLKLEGTPHELDGIVHYGQSRDIAFAAKALGIGFVSVSAETEPSWFKHEIEQVIDKHELTAIICTESVHEIVVARSDAGRLMRHLARCRLKEPQ